MIEIKNVSFTYKNGQSRNSLKEINLSIQSGETVLLCGESGCGKTTVTRLINGLIPHYYEGTLDGSVEINGRDVKNVSLFETSEKVGSVFQNPRSQFFCVDTTSEIAFGCENRGLPEDEITGRVFSAAEELGITNLLNKSIFNLSGGEKQKIACASVSACHPEIFVLDEPSSNLDTSTIEELTGLLRKWKKLGKTIVIAEHRLYYLKELVDKVVFMQNGEITGILNNTEFGSLSQSELAAMGLRPVELDRLHYSAVPSAGISVDFSLKNFNFAYSQARSKKEPPALDIDELKLPEGASIAVIGSNGAGKTTFSRCLCGLERSCPGYIEYGGNKIKRRKRLKKCYMVMQDVNHQLFTESVVDEVLLSMKDMENVDDFKKNSLADKILHDLDLVGLKDFHPMALSGGQKQRVAIASAVASGCEIIIFDEPTSGLDLRHMREVADNLYNLHKSGKTVIVVSHDMEFILGSCTYIVHIESGRIKECYPLDISGEQKLKDFFMAERVAAVV